MWSKPFSRSIYGDQDFPKWFSCIIRKLEQIKLNFYHNESWGLARPCFFDISIPGFGGLWNMLVRLYWPNWQTNYTRVIFHNHIGLPWLLFLLTFLWPNRGLQVTIEHGNGVDKRPCSGVSFILAFKCPISIPCGFFNIFIITRCLQWA